MFASERRPFPRRVFKAAANPFRKPSNMAVPIKIECA